MPAFCPRNGNLSRSDMSSNTPTRLVKYLHPWGPTTPVTTTWGSSNFDWDASWRPIRGRIILQQECRTLPLRVIQALDTATQGTTSRNIAIRDLTRVALFFLLCPGKYCKGGTNTAQHPFSIKDIQLFVVQQPYNSATVSNVVLSQADSVSLLFITQNNGVKGESIGHGRTIHPQECPMAAMRHRVAYLRRHGATGNTPISSLKKGNKSRRTISRPFN